MTQTDSNEVYAGTYMDPVGHTHKVMGVAEHREEGTRAVIYIPSHGKKCGQLLMEHVGVYVDILRSGNFKYQGPHPRILGTHLPSPGVLLSKKSGGGNGTTTI